VLLGDETILCSFCDDHDTMSLDLCSLDNGLVDALFAL
jgi:hypothetical protein